MFSQASGVPVVLNLFSHDIMHGRHVGVPKQRNGGLCELNSIVEQMSSFSLKYIAVDHVSENQEYT